MKKQKILKKLAKIWILLNGILIISTIIKNSEYVSYFGLTYKRLGVLCFLDFSDNWIGYFLFKNYKAKNKCFSFQSNDLVFLWNDSFMQFCELGKYDYALQYFSK